MKEKWEIDEMQGNKHSRIGERILFWLLPHSTHF